MGAEMNRDYQTVAASQTTAALGGAGGKRGDIIERLIVKVATAATSAVDIKDGSDTAFNVVAANTPVGTHVVTLGVRSRTGPWQVTTGAGVAVTAVGRFT